MKIMIYTQFIDNNTINSYDHMKNIHPYATTIGLAIETERKKRHLTQTQLAELSNSSINFISQVESGKTTAQIGKVLDVLNVLGLQLNIEKGAAGVVNHVK